MRKVFLLFGIFLVLSRPAAADIGVIVLEPIKTLGYVTRAGDVATYLSNVCPDDSPVRMRLCRPDERGGVVSKHTSHGRNGEYDWSIAPFDEFVYGTAAADLAPMISTPQLRDIVHGARLDRTLYLFSIPTTRGDDQRIIDAFNRTSNTSHFNVFYDNCSDQARMFFSLVLPRKDISDRTNGLTMQTPKGLAKSLVDLAREHPEFQLRVERYAQTAGAGPRSREVLFPMENVYRNPSFAPYWFFEGFREFAAGAFVYHKVFSRFSVPGAFVRFASPASTGLSDVQQMSYAREFERLTGLHADGKTGARLFKDFEARGEFSVGELGPGPWMTLELDGEEVSTGLSPAHIGDGDSRLARLILAAAIDYHLNAPDQRRASAREVERMFQLLRTTTRNRNDDQRRAAERAESHLPTQPLLLH